MGRELFRHYRIKHRLVRYAFSNGPPCDSLATAPDRTDCQRLSRPSTDTGRASFWAEAAHERNGVIHFVFPNRMTWDATILEAVLPYRYCIRYVGHSVTTFDLTDDGNGGTDLTVIDSGVPVRDRAEVMAGWVSVLMNLKAVVDFGVDLRAHDPERHWETGYVEN